MFTDIAITPMYVTDQDAALTFYCDKLGFVIDTDADLGNMRWLTVRLPAAPNGRSCCSASATRPPPARPRPPTCCAS